MLTNIGLSILAVLAVAALAFMGRRIFKLDKQAAQRQQLRTQKEMLYERLAQAVRVYLRERDNKVPDALLMRNDRDVMRSLLKDLDDVDKLIRGTKLG